MQANDLETLEALAEQLEDDQHRITVALRQGKYYTEISDWPTALEYLERALNLARATGNRGREADGLAFLSRIHLYLGDFAASLNYREKALAISRTLGDRQQQARGLSACSTLHLAMGHHQLAQDCCEQALALCRITGDQQVEAHSLYTLSRILNDLGNLASAREYMSQAQDIAQMTGDRYREAYYRMELGNHHYRLGDFRIAKELIEQAHIIFQQINEVRGQGYTLTDLSLVYHALNDHDAARDSCARGLDLLRAVGDRWGEAGCLQHLGLVVEELGDWDSAADAYTQALDMNQEIEQPVRALENRLGLARVALVHGRIAEAMESVEDMVAWIRAEGIQNLDFPFIEYMTIYKVLLAAGDTGRARGFLIEAHDTLMERAEKLEDPSIRDMFLENVAVHREIVTAYRDLQPSQQEHSITVSLPRADAPLGRALREDEFVTIAWAVAAPEDQAIVGKIARRRQRILRLLREAQAQGAAPRDEDLVKVLGVSLSTLRRDMAALRAEGHHLPTRWRKMTT
jgi:tetratricopeptide (TPR) repeat protein